jgi:hypothetical protein
MRVPTVEDRLEDIRKRSLVLGFVFDALALNRESEYGMREPDSEVWYALREYAESIDASIRAIHAAERGRPNLDAPDVESDEEGGA